MKDPWIRVHANLNHKPVVHRAAGELGVSVHEAMGLLVQFWGSVSQHRRNGDLTDSSDFQLEAWAGWRRKKGKFATFVRQHHVDADGRIREWDEYQSHLEERRERSDSPDGKSTYVYYAIDGDVCKIGWSGNPWARLNDLRTHRPAIRLAAIERGRRDLEARRHTQFAASRVQREWFNLTDDLRAHIAALIEQSRSSDSSAFRSYAEETTANTTAHATESPTRRPAHTRAGANEDEDDTKRDAFTPSTPAGVIDDVIAALPPESRVTWEGVVRSFRDGTGMPGMKPADDRDIAVGLREWRAAYPTPPYSARRAMRFVIDAAERRGQVPGEHASSGRKGVVSGPELRDRNEANARAGVEMVEAMVRAGGALP